MQTLPITLIMNTVELHRTFTNPRYLKTNCTACLMIIPEIMQYVCLEKDLQIVLAPFYIITCQNVFFDCNIKRQLHLR